MDNKQGFKEFVRYNPKLIRYVKTGEKTWQDFYDIYNLYGDDKNAWNDYLNEKTDKQKVSENSIDIMSWLRSIDLDSIQNGISSIQRVLGVVQDLNNNDSSIKEEYKPRPIYKHFED